MRGWLSLAPVVLTCWFSLGSSYGGEPTCQMLFPEPFSKGEPFHLNDPRTRFALEVEGDGRQMSAIALDGRLVWRRNLFGGPKLHKHFPPPPKIEGLTYDHEDYGQSYVNHLHIDRIGVQPDCVLRFIDHSLPSQFRGHYILAGSGTHIFWLIDAKTGDIQMEQVN